MPSRRSSASMPPRSVLASASRTMRSFSAAVKTRLLPVVGLLSSAAPRSLAVDSRAAGAERNFVVC